MIPKILMISFNLDEVQFLISHLLLSDGYLFVFVALLTVLAQRGLLGNEHEFYSKFNEKEADELPLNILFAEAIKGPLLSSDRELQLSTLELIICYLSTEGTSIKQIQLLVEENIVDYVFEIVRFSGEQS